MRPGSSSLMRPGARIQLVDEARIQLVDEDETYAICLDGAIDRHLYIKAEKLGLNLGGCALLSR